MEIIADILLIAGATGAAYYCIVLSRRLSRLNDMESGVGGAISALSSQVNEMTQTIARAQQSAGESAQTLSGLTERGEKVARRLELLVASMHDLPTESPSHIVKQTPKAEGEASPRNNKNLKNSSNSLFRSARKESDEVSV